MLGYVDGAVAVSDVKVKHSLVIDNELAFPLLIGNGIFRPHCAIIKLGPPEVVWLGVDLCLECVEQGKSVTPNYHVAAAVIAVLSDTTLLSNAASRVPVSLPPIVVETQLFC